jgi:hypothetical membrane protein
LKPVNKNKINYILNWLAFLGGLAVLVTGIMRFSNVLTFIVINIGPLDTNMLNAVHRWMGVATAAVILVHIILHWRWVVRVSKNFFKFR